MHVEHAWQTLFARDMPRLEPCAAENMKEVHYEQDVLPGSGE